MPELEITTKPFSSQAQWRFAFATGQPWARRWAHETPGGEGERFRKLPSRKWGKRKYKAPNYSARAGETIAGNLARGGDGKFTSAGSAAPAEEPAQRRGRRPAKSDAQKRQEREQRRAERQQERAAERKANIDKGFQASGLNEDAYYQLVDFADGAVDQPDGEQELEAAGLIEKGRDGRYRMTPTGRQLVNAAERGDMRGVQDAISQGRDNVGEAQDRQTAAQERQAARDQRKREVEARRQARAAEVAKRRAEAEQRRQERAQRRGQGRDRGEGREARDRAQGTGTREPDRTQAALEKLRLATERLRRGRQQLAGKSFQVYKDARGRDRWVAISSTAYRDRDNEIVSTKALAGAVAMGDQSGSRGPLRWWHVPGLDIGDCDFQATTADGRVLIESGTFRKPVYARAVAKAAPDLQLSIGFTHPETEPDRHGVFSHIGIFERSLVPAGRAANPFTRLSVKERRMDTRKLEAARALFGDAVLKEILGEAQTTDKAAQEAKVAFKEAPVEVVINGITYTQKAPPPMVEEEEAEEMIEPEAKADIAAEETTEEVMAPEGSYLGDMSPEEFWAALDERLARIEAALNIETKMGKMFDEMKGMMGGYTKQKDDADAAKAQEIAALKTQQDELNRRLKELEGDQPAAQGYRPTQDPQTVLKDAQAVAAAQPGSESDIAHFANFLLAGG